MKLVCDNCARVFEQTESLASNVYAVFCSTACRAGVLRSVNDALHAKSILRQRPYTKELWAEAFARELERNRAFMAAYPPRPSRPLPWHRKALARIGWFTWSRRFAHAWRALRGIECEES